MGRRRKQQKRRQEAAAGDDEYEEPWVYLKRLPGFIWLLFETPSGFAIFHVDGIYLKKENALENIWSKFVEGYLGIAWMKEFQEFEDKPAAINLTTGIDKRLREMLEKWCYGQKLAVGSPEHKTIIETDQKLGITCLYDDVIMEVMWGLKNLMHGLVPQEKNALTKEERLPMSKGLEMLLHRYNVDIKPEMVNDDIVKTACAVHRCDLLEKKHFQSVHSVDKYLMEISGLNSSDWDVTKLITTLQMIFYPEKEIEYPPEMFSPDELSKIRDDAYKYKDVILNKHCIPVVYQDLLYVYKLKASNLAHMRSLVKDAKEEAVCCQDVADSS